MPDNLKSDIIEGAYSKLRISGITVNPTAENNELALRRLENLAAELEGQNIKLGYAFEDDPDPATPHNMTRDKWDAMESQLAYKVMPDFGKGMKPDQVLMKLANAALSYLNSCDVEVPQTQYPRRMPIGHGNTKRVGGFRYRQYSEKPEQSPISTKTIQMYIDDINSYTEHFEAYLLASEDIASYTITAEDGITITTSSLSSPDVNYTVRADGSDSGNDSLVKVKIVVTTDAGRKETRIINFKLIDSEIEA